MYDANSDNEDTCIDSRGAILRGNDNSNNRRTIPREIFGETKNIALPIKDEVQDGYEDVTKQFLNYITTLAQEKILKEKNFSIWKTILKKYGVYAIDKPEPIYPEVFFVELDVKQKGTADVVTSPSIPTLVTDNEGLTHIKELVAKKEFLEGLIKFRPMKFKNTIIDKPYGEYYLPGQDTTVYGSYTPGLREAMFGDEKYYKIIRPGEVLQPRQRKAKLYTGWITAIIAARRSGKTVLAGDIVVEEMTRDKQFHTKPIKVIFIGINQKKNKTVIDYILKMTNKMRNGGLFRWSTDDILYYEEIDEKKNRIPRGECRFLGSKDDDVGVGDSADLIIIDECERIPKQIYDDILPIATTEGARLLLISTLNKRSEKTWFYEVITKGEKEELTRELSQQNPEQIVNEMWNKRVQPHIDSGQPFEKRIKKIDIDEMRREMLMTRMWVGIRFTGDDIDYLTEKQKEFSRKALMAKPEVYYPERWGIFPDDVNTYDFEGCMVDAAAFLEYTYDYIVLAYDPAESRDRAALVFLGMQRDRKKICIFREMELPNNYTFQGSVIKKMKKDAERFLKPSDIPAENRIYFVYDHTGVGNGLEPYFIEVGLRVDGKIKFTSSSSWNKEAKKFGQRNVGKGYMVNALQNLFEHNSLEISKECVILKEELTNYGGKTNSKTGYTKYEAQKGTDDSVSATMLGAFFIMDVMGEAKTIVKNEFDKTDGTPLSNKERNELVIPELRKGKTLEQIKAEAQGKIWNPQGDRKKRDILARFGY